MPLYKTITEPSGTAVYIWKIQESYQELAAPVTLTSSNSERVAGMKSEIHRRGFLSIRHALALAGYSDTDLFYDPNGKPHLKDGKFISITHSFERSGIVISNKPVGIDIEMERNKILKIAHKFTPIQEYRTLANEEALIRKLSLVWCAKESLYKLYAQPGLSFLQHIIVDDFSLESDQTTASIVFNGIESRYQVYFMEFDGYSFAYALPLAYE